MEQKSTKKKSKAARSYNTRNASPKQICSLPEVLPRELPPEVGPERASLIRNSENKWANGTRLHYHFLTAPSSWAGSAADKEKVREAFRAWKQVGIGLDFEEVSSADDAEIRIAFQRNSGHWSYIGRVVLRIDQSDRTMNLDKGDAWDVDTAIHEIGHTLGFPHEHQNPNAGIVWNDEAVYADLGGPPNNWSRQKTFHNIIRKLDPGEVSGSAWDKDSIMHYPFKAGLIEQPPIYKNEPLNPAPGLSTVDKSEAKSFYPSLGTRDHRKLAPFQFERLELKPREQANFIIQPKATRSYRISTFGRADTVMVLFEDVNGVPRFSIGDDDSGFDRNSSLEARLFQGRTYYLRCRLYSVHRQGEFGLMMW